MKCPDEIAEILLEILTRGLLAVRAAGWQKNPVRCAIEADHLHNLPALIATYSPDRLRYYWEAERISFMHQSSTDDLHAFEPLWNRLADAMKHQKDESLAAIA